MKTRCFTLYCTLLTAAIFLFSFPTVCTSIYPEGAFDLTTIDTQMTLKAKHIVVGEVVGVSFAFTRPEFKLPSSFVTVRIDLDIKKEIERADHPSAEAKRSQQDQTEKDPPTVTFVQVGGPYPDGTVAQAVGVPFLELGDRVFLRLVPTIRAVTHQDTTSNLTISDFGCKFDLKENGEALDDHIVQRGWQGMNATVFQMARITRATLKQPKRMESLERRVNALARPRPIINVDGSVHMPDDARFNIVMEEVAAIESELNLPPLVKSVPKQ